MKKIVLVAGSEQTRAVLYNQLQEYLGGMAVIEAYATDEGIEEELLGDLYVFSSKITFQEMNSKINPEIPVIIATRSINFNTIDKLLYLPSESEVLFVNDTKETTYSCIDNLMNLEINHIKYIPYYPGIESYKFCEIAVTPGEADKVPNTVKNIIDLGARPFDMSTLTNIMYKLGFYDDRVSNVTSKYVRKIIELGKKLANKNNEVITLNRDLERIIIDINRFQINKEGNIISINDNKESVEVNKETRKELVRKRYYAKFDFDDISGESRAILETKNIAEKLAKTEITILIEGESGTGKELFASSMHNYSKRKDGPFLAVNFSALTESLVESELFGYDDGSFTGARKGGKLGIFEQAKGGTIFLDEISDASLAVQTRLLRVLQEKEIMRIGGDRIIPIDVRVIAATNKNLPKLISEGKFREDLYYRLKMGYLNVPPLRERKEDIPLICQGFLKKKKKNIKLSKELLDVFCQRNWKGNVRELLNSLEYALAINEGEELKVQDLPFDFKKDFSYAETKNSHIDKELEEILYEIYNSQKNGEIIGRRILCENLSDKGFSVSEQSIRTKLNNIEKLGFITKNKGKLGTKLTELGIKYIRENGNE
jgi:sigma-54 dependent transcriptional regulator, acetoin dehydrogenase operon transcriptional activator AcoR